MINLEVSIHKLADVVVVVPAGQIDHPNAQRLQEALASTLDESRPGNDALLFDFSGVSYISSMGLRVLMVAAKQIRSRNARIAVVALRPVVKEIFDIARFNHVLEVFPTMRDALQKLSVPALAAFDAASK